MTAIIQQNNLKKRNKNNMNKRTKKLEKCSACQTAKYECLENCDECKKEFCIECLGLYHGSERLFCQECFDKKSDEEKAIMLGKENKEYYDKQLETKRKNYREWVIKNPFPIEHGIEMKECEGCYCQMSYNCGYDFCFDCIDCDNLSCGGHEYDPDAGNCCACYGGKNKKLKLKRKKLTFAQKQRLHWEQMKQRAEDVIEEIKDDEDTDDMQTAKQIEDVKRWSEQNKQRTIKSLTDEELLAELKKRKLKL